MDKKAWWRDPNSRESSIINLICGCLFLFGAIGGWALLYVDYAHYSLFTWSAVEQIFSLGFILIFVSVIGSILIYRNYRKLKA